MRDYEREAELVENALIAEAASGKRDPRLDGALEMLRETWKSMTPERRAETEALTGRLSELVAERPWALQAEPAGEQDEAMLALRGLEDARTAAAGEVRLYDGPPHPDLLLAHLGLDSFRAGQRDAVQAALDGRDSLVVMPTGGGKSLCYQLPGLASADLTIVVSPLIALMADQWKRLRAGGHPAAMIASGLGDDQARAALDAIAGGQARIAYCSPERFGSTAFLDAIGRRRVDLLAIDEAHCISEWGHDFRPDYLRLPGVRERLGEPPVMACTATATTAVATEIRERLRLRDPLEVRSGFDRPNLSFDIVAFEGKGSKGRKLALLRHALADESNRPAIVYCGTRRDTEEVGAELRESGLTAAAYHAGMAPDERASAQHRFMEGDAEVITATNAFGMGIDKADVRSVWHWAMPSSVEAYYQEAGRAGRDGAPSRAVLLASRSDLGRLVRFIQQREVDPERVISHAGRLRAQSDAGRLVIDNPREDADRISLAIAERSGMVAIEAAPGGRLALSFDGEPNPAAIRASCRAATDRGWRAYRAIEAYSFADRCRRRMLLEHFGDASDPEPQGRCCDICDPETGLPDPDTLAVGSRRRGKGKKPAPAAVELAGEEAALFERLRVWRRDAAAGKPAYTVANDRTLAAIATERPADRAALSAIHGVGPAFLDRHAEAVLELLSGV